MDQQNLGGGGQTGSEDSSEAQRHVHNAEENRDALEAQARRTDATTPRDVADQPIRGIDGGQGGGTSGSQGLNASGQGGGTQGDQGLSASGTGGQGGDDGRSEDTSRATAHTENAERNRDALEAQNRRVEETAPESTRQDLRDR